MPGRSQIEIKPANQLFVFDKRQLRKTMRQAGQEVAAVVRRKLRSAGKGKKQLHSLPGQPPVSQTGNLLRSIKVVAFKSGLGVAVRSTAFYALMLEAGAQGGSPGRKNVYGKRGRVRSRLSVTGGRILLPRPFLTTALDERETSLAGRVQQAVLEGVAFKKIRP